MSTKVQKLVDIQNHYLLIYSASLIIFHQPARYLKCLLRELESTTTRIFFASSTDSRIMNGVFPKKNISSVGLNISRHVWGNRANGCSTCSLPPFWAGGGGHGGVRLHRASAGVVIVCSVYFRVAQMLWLLSKRVLRLWASHTSSAPSSQGVPRP